MGIGALVLVWWYTTKERKEEGRIPVGRGRERKEGRQGSLNTFNFSDQTGIGGIRQLGGGRNKGSGGRQRRYGSSEGCTRKSINLPQN
jgi:hypothetical protein